MDKKEMQKQQKRNMQVGVAVVAAAVILMILVRIAMIGMLTASGGSGTYTHYAGPVLPMTMLSGPASIEADRHVTFDFSPLFREKNHPLADSQILIHDRYTLHPKDGPVQVCLAYGFQGQLTDSAEQVPQICVNGVPAKVKLYSAVDSEEWTNRATSWEEYRDALQQNNFLAEAIAPPPENKTPVTVYRFSQLRTMESDAQDDSYLHISYTINREKTKVWKFGYVSEGEYEDGTIWNSVQIPAIASDFWTPNEAFLIVEGEDLANLEVDGIHGYQKSADNLDPNVSYDLERYETTFEQIVWELAEAYGQWKQYDGSEISAYDTQSILYDGAMKRMCNERLAKRSYYSINELFGRVVSDDRMLYWVFDVEIPSDGVVVEVVYHQEMSHEGKGKQALSEGVDLAVRLGSVLQFNALSASVQNTEKVRLVDQNFGFDLASGVCSVELDTQAERYYMKVAVQTE